MRVLHPRNWMPELLVLPLALAVALAPTTVLAQDDDDLFSDDFLEEGYVEPEEQAAENGVLYWAFNVPVDIFLSRPLAINDSVVGGAFFLAATPILGIFGGGKALWDYAWGEGWYFDNGNLQAALQICVQDPWAYTWNRPLGQLTSEY